MIAYFKMKHKQWKAKALIYGFITTAAESAQNLFAALGDVSSDELRQELISAIAERAHQQAKKKKKTERESHV